MVGDPPERRGVRNRVGTVPAVVPAATPTGARSFAAITQWAHDVAVDITVQLGAAGREPTETTIRRPPHQVPPTSSTR